MTISCDFCKWLYQVLSVTMLLTSKDDYAECNTEYIKHFGVNREGLPARATALWGVPTEAKVAFSCVALHVPAE